MYLLCLLLGFEGMHAGSARNDASAAAERLRSRIDGIRSSDYRLSPQPRLSESASPTIPYRVETNWWYLPLGAVCAALLLFIAFKAHLAMRLSEFASSLGMPQ